MEDGVRSQVRLASGGRRGLFAAAPSGGRVAVLLSPLDICIVAPFGDADPLAAEFGTAGNKDTLVILRRAWETRNKAKIPGYRKLSPTRRVGKIELGVVLWPLGVQPSGDIWRARGLAPAA